MRYWDRIRLYRESGPQALSEPWAEVPAETFRQLVTELFHPRLLRHRFERTSESRWVRSRIPEARDVVEIVALKGCSYSAMWGLSLDFVPTILNGKEWSWHRTTKSARMDLAFDPFDYEVTATRWSVTRMEHAHDLPTAVCEWADLVVPEAIEFFKPIQVLGDVERAFAQKESRKYVRFGPQNYRQHFLAHAFVLARLGRMAEAAQALGKSLERFPLEPEIEARVRQSIQAES